MIHPNQDHQYQIVAEVTDPSRRTIVGEAAVLVGRKPFQVTAWVDRGYYRVGDVIRADFHAETLSGKPVRGDGQLTLFKVTYKDAKPVETQVRTWALATDEQGSATLQLKASEPGQYRLAYRLTDEKKQTEEAGYLLTVVGDGFDGSDFRFNDIEVDSRSAAVRSGLQTVNLMIQHGPARRWPCCCSSGPRAAFTSNRSCWLSRGNPPSKPSRSRPRTCPISTSRRLTVAEGPSL